MHRSPTSLREISAITFPIDRTPEDVVRLLHLGLTFIVLFQLLNYTGCFWGDDKSNRTGSLGTVGSEIGDPTFDLIETILDFLLYVSL